MSAVPFSPHNHDQSNDFDYEMHYDCAACYEQPESGGNNGGVPGPTNDPPGQRVRTTGPLESGY